LILLLIFVVRTSASDCLDWRTISEMTCNVSSGTLNRTHSLTASRGLGVNFLPAKGFKRGPPHCVETTFSYRYCRLTVKTIIQWYIAKNRGGYTLEMRRRRCRAPKARGSRRRGGGVGL